MALDLMLLNTTRRSYNNTHLQFLNNFMFLKDVPAPDFELVFTTKTRVTGLFLDSDGISQRSYISPVGINPGVDEIIEALESITKKN
jgi:hypothetical protein